MYQTEELSFKIHQYERIAETNTLRVSILTLTKGQEVPWHSHSNVNDDFFCMEGPMQIELRDPDRIQLLQPGETWRVISGQPHRVRGINGNPCRFMLVQGVGKYDFVQE